MQKVSITRPSQPPKRKQILKLAVLAPKQNNTSNFISSSDPDRNGDNALAQSIKLQNRNSKDAQKVGGLPNVLKSKSSNQVFPSEFQFPQILADFQPKDRSHESGAPSTKLYLMHFKGRNPLKAKYVKIQTDHHEKKKNTMPSIDNNPFADKLKAFKFLKPITNDLTDSHNISEMGSLVNNNDYKQDIFEADEYDDNKQVDQHLLTESVLRDKSPLFGGSNRYPVEDQNTKIVKQHFSNAGTGRHSPEKDFRIQNFSSKKSKVRPPTSPQSISYPNQYPFILVANKDKLNQTPEIKATDNNSIYSNNVLLQESFLHPPNYRNKKSLSPPKLRISEKDKTKIAEIKQQVLTLEHSNINSLDKTKPNSGIVTNESSLIEDDLSSQDIDEIDSEENEIEESCQTAKSTNKKVLMLESVYSNRPPTIFFPYPACCEKVRDPTRTHGITAEDEKAYDLKYKAPILNCVKRTFETAGFKKTEGDSWNVLWAQPKYDRVKEMNRYQKTNHFPGCWEVGRKDGLWRNLSKMKRQFPTDYNFIPNTYLLCSDYERFLKIRETSENNAIWILKPCNSACGRGIKLINKNTKLNKNPNYLVSEYISNPHLIDGHKYDLRVYVLVSSYDPLRIYIYQEGLVRFATEKYRTTKKHLKKKFAHLTNWSVNKHSTKFVKNESVENDGEGSKWSFSALRKRFKEMGIDYHKIMNKVKDIIIKTMISVDPLMLNAFNRTQEHKNNCFELYGFDILLDSNLKAWLMEVNVCASLNSSSPLDKKIKTSLMCDIMNLIGIQPYNKKKFDEETKKKSTGIENRKHFAKNYYELYDLDETNCIEKLTPEDWNILFETDEEYYRRGYFERLFPLKENIETYSKYFEYQRYNNILVWQWLKSKTNFLEKISKKNSIISV